MGRLAPLLARGSTANSHGAVRRRRGARTGMELIQRQATGPVKLAPGAGLGAELRAARAGGGEALPAAVRGAMEPAFREDFGDVRVHRGPAAGALAEGLGARAFTLGRDVFFGRSQYAPGTRSGDRLLAHELTHVVHQRSGPERVQRKPDGTRKEPLAPTDVTRVTAEFGVRLGRDADLKVVSGTIPKGALVRVIEVEEGGNKLKIARLEGGEIAAPIGWTLRGFLGAKEQPPAALPAVPAAGPKAAGQSAGGPRVIGELPVSFVASEIPAGLGASASAAGLSLHVLASGDLSWLSGPAAARRVLSAEYWAPLVPRRGTVVLDRLVNELPRDLAPKIEAEFAAQSKAGAQRLTWLGKGFTEAELRSLPELVARLSRGEELAAAELSVLRRAAALHLGGSTTGAPFASFMTPGHTLTNVGAREFRVRVELPSTSVLDVSVPNEFNQGVFELTNVDEAEWLVTSSKEGRILSVQRGGASEASFLLRHSDKIRWGGRVVLVAGLGVSAHRIATASPSERGVVIAEEAGGQVGGAVGGALAVAGCVFFGIATGGVGLFVCGLAGGLAGGIGGTALGGAMARSARASGGEPPCPSCHAQQRERAQRLDALDLRSLEAIGKPSGVLSSDDIGALERWLTAREAPAPGGSGSISPADLAFMRRWLESLPPR